MFTFFIAISSFSPPAEPGVLFVRAKENGSLTTAVQVLALPILPGRHQPSIVGRDELNYRVRNGNGWTLIVIGTDSIFNAFNVKSIYILHRFRAVFFGDPYGIRTHVAGVRGRSLRPLDQRAVWYTFRDSNPGHPD